MHDTKDKLTAFLKLGLQYAAFLILLLLAFGASIDSIGAGIVIAATSLLLLPVIREKIPSKDLRHPLLTTVVIIGAIILSTNISDKSAVDKRERQKTEMAEATRAENEKALADFSANSQPKIDEIKNLIEKKDYNAARSQINLFKEVNNQELGALDEQLVKIEEKIEEKRQQAEAKAVKEQQIAKAAELWSYSHTDDPMSKGITRLASLYSSNTVNFDFPYGGEQNGSLTLRTDPKYGKDVIFSIEKGQILCASYDGCTVLVRFDDEDAASYTAVGAADNSSETIFIRNYSRFIEKMMKAKRVRISVNIYQEGSPVFDFDVSGFSKDKYQQKV